jgi:hypothetical protein
MDDRRRWTRRGFLTTTAGAVVSAGVGNALPVAASADASPEPRTGSSDALRPFPLDRVRLTPGPFLEARDRNSGYLLSLPQDRLLRSFRINAGMTASAEPLGGWEKPDCELRGHFTGGHYLSACALTYAATGEEEFRARANAMVTELAKCQKALGSGYLSAFPEEQFDRLRAGVKVWAPFYTYDKILRGHLDVHRLCGNAEALATAERMAAWVRNWTKGLSDAHRERILTIEYGGMNAVLYDLADVTKKEEYRDLAHWFDQNAFFDPLAARKDELTGLHANTQFPKVIGAARRYELTGETRYRDIAQYFWREVTGLRAYATGGTSDGERWETPPGVLSTALSSSSAECCCAYNMLKLTRHIFAWTADPRAADYYERTLWNHRLGTQNPEDGTLMYYYPLASGYWKFYGAPLTAFWCCTGTGVEEFAKAGDSIYFHDDAGIFVNLFIASEVKWPEKGVRLVQETAFPEQEGAAFRIEMDRPSSWTLRLRVPWWATRGGRVRVNGEALPAFSSPSSYLALTRTWKSGDRVELDLPMSLSAEPTPDDPTVLAAMYGPLVLAGRLGSEKLTRNMTYGEYDCELKGEPVAVDAIAGDPRDVSSWIEPAARRRLAFRTRGQAKELELVPLNRLFGERYAVYWKVRPTRA